MTELEQVEYKLSYLLSQYEQRKADATYRIQVAYLAAKRRELLANGADSGLDK